MYILVNFFCSPHLQKCWARPVKLISLHTRGAATTNLKNLRYGSSKGVRIVALFVLALNSSMS